MNLIELLTEILNKLISLNNSFEEALQLQQVNVTPEEWLHEDVVMKIFGNTRKTMYNWRKQHKLQSRKFGRYHYYLKSEVYKLANL